MKRYARLCLLFLSLTCISLAADAQGRRPSGAGAHRGTARPGTGRPLDIGRANMASQRQEMEAAREAAAARQQEAERRRLEAEANNRSAEARAENPPNEHAADEAFLAEENAENQELREERRELQGDNRGERGPE